MTVIEKIQELKAELNEELKKEDVNSYKINQLKIKIISLSVSLTSKDILTRNHG